MDRDFGLITGGYRRGFPFRCRSTSTATSGWRGNWRSTPSGTPSTTTRFCGSRTSRGRSASPIGLSVCPGSRCSTGTRRRVNPLLRDARTSMQYYWVTAQAEYATDLVFKRRAQLADFVPRLLDHSTLCFSARDVLSFLGRKWHGGFEGERWARSTSTLSYAAGCRGGGSSTA